MENKRKRKIGMVVLAVVVIAVLLMTLTSCDLFNKGGDTVVAPKLDDERTPRFERVNPDYFNKETNKNEIYNDEEEVMPVLSGEKVYLVIDYVNKSNLSINKIQITGGDTEKTFLSRDFEKDSDSNRTKIEFTIDEVEKPQEVTYTISKIFYHLGAQVISMTLKPEHTDLKVSVDPKFKLTFDYDNADVRTNSKRKIVEHDIVYKTPLIDIIPTVSNQGSQESYPQKLGGWSFRGYFTRSDGQGIEIKPTETFYFWQDITLYAHYERLYDFSVAKAATPIPYDDNGETKEYTKVATIIKKTSAGDAQIDLEIYDTIADDDGIYPIVAIGDAAFDKTSNLRNLKLGKYVRYIGQDAFSSSRVMNIEFNPNGVLEKIDNRAFFGTSNLGTGIRPFTLPNTVKFLGDRCFESSNWGKMVANGETAPSTKLTIYDNITHIGNWCFVDTKFTEVVFSAGVKFKADAVSGTNYVEEINGEQVTADSDYYLGWALFKKCENIRTFRTLTDEGEANGLEIITAGMFDIFVHNSKPNVGLTNIVLAEGLKIIERGAFRYQKLLQIINLPNSLEDICSENQVNGSGAIFEGTRNEKSEYGAFGECEKISQINFGEDSQLKAVGCNAFCNNKSLRNIKFTSKVFELYGDGPFQGCDNLIEVYFCVDDPEKVPQPITDSKRTDLLGIKRTSSDFFYPMGTFKVFVEDNVVNEFRDSFKIYASDGVKKSMAVYSHNMIKTLDIEGKEVKMALEGTTSILDSSIGWSLGYYFNDAEDTTIVIPNEYEGTKIVAIGSYAFDTIIEKVTLPFYTAKIASYAFYNCTKLTEVLYGGEDDPGIISLIEIGEQAFYKTAITKFVGGINLERIEENAFWESKLVVVDLQKSSNLGTANNPIGASAFFQNKNLKYVRLPSSFAVMSGSLFANCTALRHIVFENTGPPSNMFGTTATSFLGVPSGVITAYAMNATVVDTYNNLANMPNALRGGFQSYPNSNNQSPSPEDLGINL